MDDMLWLAGWEDGAIENQSKIDELRNLEEFVLVTRELDDYGRDFRGDSVSLYEGVPEFVEYPDGSLHRDLEICMKHCMTEFERIKRLDAKWRVPEVRFVKLRRDGVFV